ncbi:MAG: stage 0 sporulation protein [Anaerolineales bacterium]|nr:stage 0 sporulation protein [Anaerolineales bacterium]MCX7608713.1 stage 0 sporulation protein [Anaerolineales bacterium]MDW8228086.1 regulatory iron-sulfur-containing complex subunit RicT [Anaerolineales bacterium]
MPPLIVGIRFAQVGKIYHFDASAVPEIKVGDHAIVETSRGKQLGEVVQIISDPVPPPEGWKPVERIATPRDLVLRRMWMQKELEAMIACRERAAQLNLRGVKIVAAEFSFDGTRLAFMYSADTEEKVDLKSLRQDMQKQYPQAQVELRQIGPRDVAKLLGGMGACGLETRCCSRFLTEFSPVSIKMAKEQGISLTPEEITGMCGRLRCCLVYEYEQYAAARKELPKKNKWVITPLGEGKVVDVNPLQMLVRVALPELGEREFHRDELEPWDELEALRRKAAAPCENCGKKNGNTPTS